MEKYKHKPSFAKATEGEENRKYDHRQIESKWQKIWADKNVAKIDKDDTKNKFYMLDMFPYPSGDGLHMGHTESYTASDVFYRFKKMQGFNVLHPQGFDAFGLPAENFAIKTGVHPAQTTEKNIATYIKQMKSLGLNYDFDEQAVTSDPKYYKWTQWIFSQFYKNNLVYKRTQKANWCSSCQTVIANEQVVGGECERCGTEIVQKEIPGWFFKITDFADDLIDGLDKVDWPEHTKKNQKNWIGKSEGAKIKFPLVIASGSEAIQKEKTQNTNSKDYQTKHKTQISNVIMIHGCPGNEEKAMNPETRTYDKHWQPWIKNELEKREIKVEFPLMPHPWCPSYEDHKKEFEKLDVNENSVLIGHSCGTSFLLRWLGETKQKVKSLIMIAPWQELEEDIKRKSDFYTFDIDETIKDRVENIIIFTSNDEDEIGIKSAKDFAEKLNAKVISLENHGHYCEGDIGTNEFTELLEEILKTKNSKLKTEIEVFTTRPDTLFGATYMVLAPEHKLVTELKDQITNWGEVEKYIIQTQNKTELDRMEGKEKTGVKLEGIMAINPANQEEIPVFIADYVLGGYGTGAIMAVPAHDERDFEFAKKYGLPNKEVISPKDFSVSGSSIENKNNLLGYLKNKLFNPYIGEGFLINSVQFTGLDSEEAKKEITEFVGGKMTSNYRLRDWSISRQRYWGCPIPIVYSPEGEAKIVPEEYLPWTLPTDVDFKPTGVSPLSESKELKERVEKIFGIGWIPEYDTMDTFVDSSWYFLRYPDVHNDSDFCSEARKKWLPVDLYIGGAEHTYMHLLFARFFTKAMYKIGLLDFDEPFLKLRHQGMVLDAKGKKMSKSKGNVVNPDEMVERFGADSVRAYMLFAAPLEDEVIWNEDNIVGVYRFLEKVWRIRVNAELTRNYAEHTQKNSVKNILHKTIKKVTNDIENLRYNTAVSSMMILANEIEKIKEIEKEDYQAFLKLLSPFAPHITQELWEQLGNDSLIQNEKWPEYDENLTKDNTHTIALQVNGKVRSEIEIEDCLSEEEIKNLALQDEVVKKWVGENEPKKIIYVKNRLVNIVV